MIIRISSPDISGNEKTYLSSVASASDTTLTVQNIEGFSTSEYLVLGKLGEEQTELVQIHTATSPSGSTITLTGAISFAHAVNTPVTYIGFNQVKVYTASSKSGTYTEHASSPVSIEADQDFTEFNDTTGSTSTWYKTSYYNSTSTTESTKSDPVQGTGYTDESLRKIIDKANSITDDKDDKVFSEDDKIDIVNDGYQGVINRLEKADAKRFLKQGYVDIKNSYDTGTASVSDGSTSVTGSSTTWDTDWANKKIIFNDEGYYYDIASIDSTTGLTLSRAYEADDDLSGESYEIFQDEYTLYDASDGTAVEDFKKIEKVYDEDGNEVHEYDVHRTEDGYYLKREGTNLKLCLNYRPNTSDDEGRWMVWYSYQPSRMDSMADEPEFPLGYAGILVDYLASRIERRKGSFDKASFYEASFINGTDKLIGQSVPRTSRKRGFRIDRNLRKHYQHDEDWGHSNLWGRETIE